MAADKVILVPNERDRRSPHSESGNDRLRRTITPDAMSIDLVSAFSGDRDMTDVERDRIHALIEERGGVFFSDLFYAATHHYFAPEIAETLWGSVVQHKHSMSERLGRNVRITVATLDYLSNITDELVAPTLMPEAYVAEIANLSMRDGLTGLFNHSTCYELLELELRNHRRYGVGVSLVILDIDEFKEVNDRHGHQEGDRVLVELAKTLTEVARDSDICCRLGGDEFSVVLRLTNDPDEACDIAERIREAASHITCGSMRIAISVGVALCDHLVTSPRVLIEKADRALYEAKVAGKNQVVLDGMNDRMVSADHGPPPQ